MNSAFVANASLSRAEPDVDSGAFWPTIEMAVLRASMRLAGDVTAERLRAAVVAALIAVNDELAQWQLGQELAGHGRLQDVPSPLVDGRSRLVQLYLRAVHCAAAVEVAERYRSVDATSQAGQRADDMTPTMDEMRRDLRYALRDLAGVGRVTVELI